MAGRPSIEDQIEFYDSWNKKHRGDEYAEIHGEIKARADKILDAVEARNLPTDEILEVGCGTGWFTEKLSRLGNVTAIDLSPRAIEIAESRGTGAQFGACDIFQYDFGEKRFDLIVCVETLFYVEDADRLVEKMAELCRDGGHLAVTTINKFVYERSEDVGPPAKGQIRNWMSRRKTRDLILSFFDVVSECTVEPRGHLGILRLVNSDKLNHILRRFVAADTLKKAKERLGLGGGVIIIASKKKSSA
jgi:2-polyprenyl-3-methyl-5-hydroxy-6-metoxy-1,4-benzoquinol methylase